MHSPVIYHYLKKYQEDPRSRVFAPLAEAYRKAGLVEEAIEIAREGLENHPHFTGGRVALARALFDKQAYEEVLEQLKDVVLNAPDNLVAQRLVAESCLMLGRVADALSAYKMLLYYQPHDRELSKIVFELEAQAYSQGTLVLQNDPIVEDFNIRPVNSVIDGDPDLYRKKWMGKIEKLQKMLQKIERYRQRVQGRL